MSLDTTVRRISDRIGRPVAFLLALVVAARRVQRWRSRRAARHA